MVSKKESWFDKAIVILAISILIGVIQNIYSKLDEVENNLSQLCKASEHQALWQAIKKQEDKQTEILIKLKEIELNQ